MAQTLWLESADKTRRIRKVADLPLSRLIKITLRYGQVMWVLMELGYGAGARRETLNEYIKALRKLGIPFGGTKFQTDHRRRLAEYSYDHIMELAIVLSLRVYHVIPDSVLKGIIQYRTTLHRFYRRAYAQRRRGLGSPFVIKAKNCAPIELRGLFLDLDIKFSAGRMVRFGPPKLLSPVEAVTVFGQSTFSGKRLLPMSLSLLSEEVVALVLAAPTIRSGPPPQSDQP
jgi:hypothetical protein